MTTFNNNASNLKRVIFFQDKEFFKTAFLPKMKLVNTVVITISLFLLSIIPVEGMTLVEDGKSTSIIVIGNKPSGCIKKAVKELQTHIKRMSGVLLKVKIAPAKVDVPLNQFTQGGKAILIGNSAYTRELNLPDKKLSVDGFQIKTFKNGIAIVGNDDKKFSMNYDQYPSSAGTLYGVYYFLEELGCRWFYPDPKWDIIPKLETISIPEIAITRQPYFEYRFAYCNISWRRRIGYGGAVDPWSTRHTFSQTINVKKKYPEIAKRGFHFEHSGVPEVIIKEATNFFKKRIPLGKKYFLVIPPDAYAGCKCEKCIKLASPERGPNGSLSDYVGKTVVEVANAVKDSSKEGKIVYCAYEKYCLAPLKIQKLPENVVVLQASSRVGFNKAESREKNWEIIDQWERLSPSKYYFCRYYSGFLKLTPSFAPHMIAKDIKRMKEYKETGKLNIGGEMNFGSVGAKHPYAWWFCLNEYVTAKLLWSPDLDVDALLQDYYDKFFGPASVPMKKFFTRLEELYFTPKECYLYSIPVIDELEKLLDEAKEIVKNTNYQKNVNFIDIGFNNIRLIRKKLKSQEVSVKKQKLVAYLPFDENKGSTAKDIIRKTRCKIENGTWVEGIKGSALELSGDKSVVIMPRLNLANTDYSIVMWIKPKEVTFSSSQYLVGPMCWEQHVLRLKRGTLNMLHRHHASNYAASVTSLSAKSAEFKPDNWYYIVATFSKTNGMTLYINGVLNALDPAQKTAARFGIHFIGAGGRKGLKDLVDHFNGCIDEVKIYKRELQPQEIENDYAKYIDNHESNKK